MVYNQIFGVKLEYGIHNTPKQVDVIEIVLLIYFPLYYQGSIQNNSKQQFTIR